MKVKNIGKKYVIIFCLGSATAVLENMETKTWLMPIRIGRKLR